LPTSLHKPDSVQRDVETELLRYVTDPLGYAKFAFPWEGLLEPGPRQWQAEILGYIRDGCLPAEPASVSPWQIHCSSAAPCCSRVPVSVRKYEISR